MAKTKRKAPAVTSRDVIVKDGNWYFRSTVFGAALVACWYVSQYLDSIKGAALDANRGITQINKTLTEVKDTLSKQDGMDRNHEGRLIRLEKDVESVTRRVDALERKK